MEVEAPYVTGELKVEVEALKMKITATIEQLTMHLESKVGATWDARIRLMSYFMMMLSNSVQRHSSISFQS